jgi:hypothetical protein
MAMFSGGLLNNPDVMGLLNFLMQQQKTLGGGAPAASAAPAQKEEKKPPSGATMLGAFGLGQIDPFLTMIFANRLKNLF